MSTNHQQSLLVIGECMMELSEAGDSYNRAFAGDTYNCAVYAKRRHPQLNVQILTAVGSDPVSQAMRAQWDRDRVGHDLVMTTLDSHPGIYAITTDDRGERSFTYWRRASAATELMSLLQEDTRQALGEYNTIYFSGISLAILSEADKERFILMIAELKMQGCTIAFDPNYRPVLWQDAGQAAHWIRKAYELANIALPGLEDHKALYNHQHSEDIRRYLQMFQIDEIILKADTAGIYGYQANQDPVHLDVEPEPNPLDTTGAGDSFAGTYLAERLHGRSMIDAIHSADRVASLVVKHRGAIIDAIQYNQVIARES